jgi:hypothetical protein
MRPTAASSSKTHDKPASPPRKGTKAPVSVIQKGKKKVEEVAAKAKDAVTSNGHHSEGSTVDDSAVGEEHNGAHKAELPESEPVINKEQANVNASVSDADSTATGPQTAQATNEPVH